MEEPATVNGSLQEFFLVSVLRVRILSARSLPCSCHQNLINNKWCKMLASRNETHYINGQTDMNKTLSV